MRNENYYSRQQIETLSAPFKPLQRAILLAGIICDAEMIRRLFKKLKGQKAIAILGPSGVGKSYSVKRIVPALMKHVLNDKGKSNSEIVVVEAMLYMYRHPKDGFLIPIIKNNDLIFEVSAWIQTIQKAKADGKQIVLIIDEVTQLDETGQATLLSITEIGDKSIRLEQINEIVNLSADDKVILIGNEKALGVFEIINPLKDRIEVLEWNLPHKKVIVKMLEDVYLNQVSNVNLNTSDLCGIPVGQLKVNVRVISSIVDCMSRISSFTKSPVSLRGYIGFLDCYRHSSSLEEAIYDIRQKVEADNANGNDRVSTEIQYALIELEEKLLLVN
jgi:replication-associated recombination protein RarA